MSKWLTHYAYRTIGGKVHVGHELAGPSRCIPAKARGIAEQRRAGEIACPALLITGEHDFLAPPAIVSELAGAMPHGRFIEVKGATHMVHHENPDLLIRNIVDWLAER